WQRWDTLWYQHIAEHGYSATDGSLEFFPLFPLLSKLVSPAVAGQTVLAMLIVSTIAFAGAMFLLHRLAAVDAGARTAPWTVLAVALFPTGFFLLAPYTESLFLAFSAGTFVALRADRPWLAGLAAVGASFT